MTPHRVRPADEADRRQLETFCLAMTREMAADGDDTLADDDRVADVVSRRVAEAANDAERLLLVAEQDHVEPATVGMLEASVIGPHAVYAPKRLLHVHALFVAPEQRRRGVGRALVEAALEWGRQRGCVEADLGVLEQSPARRLYEQFGFRTFRRQMRLRL